jgi:hypothetical protein
MSADTDPRKSPCANTGNDSSKNHLPHSPNHSRGSILSFELVSIYLGELRESIRFARLAASTGDMRHVQALLRHLEGIAYRVFTQSRGGTRQ